MCACPSAKVPGVAGGCSPLGSRLRACERIGMSGSLVIPLSPLRRRGMTSGARYQEADRAQLSWDMIDLESQLASDHRARIVWAFVSGLELSALYASIRAREGEPGRPPPDPKVILALWLWETLEGSRCALQ